MLAPAKKQVSAKPSGSSSEHHALFVLPRLKASYLSPYISTDTAINHNGDLGTAALSAVMLHLLPFVRDTSKELISLYLTCKSFQHIIHHDPIARHMLFFGMRKRALLSSKGLNERLCLS